MITEGYWIPLAVSLTGGQRNDITQLMPLIPAHPPGPRPVGLPRASAWPPLRRPGL